MLSRSILIWAAVALSANALALTDCDVARTNCEAAPNSNKAACAASAAACSAGTTSSVATLIPPTSIPTPVTSPAPSSDCEKARNDCKTKPNANQAACAASFAQCTASTSTLKTLIPPTSIPVTTTSAPPPAVTNCEQARVDCQTKPDSNRAFCASQYDACTKSTSTLKTLTPPTTTSPPSPAQTSCEQARTDCQLKPDSNKSYCASQYDQCVKSNSGGAPGTNVTSIDTTVYTTVCPVTTTSGSSTYVYTTTSTITSCLSGCGVTLGEPTTRPSPAPTAPGNGTVAFTGAGSSFKPAFGLLGLAALVAMA